MKKIDRHIKPLKRQLIDIAFKLVDIKSIVDLGACWGVNGGYTFHALQNYDLDRAIIVDGVITDITVERAKKFNNLQLIKGAFNDKEIIKELGNVDAAIMYDILLHQVSPNWDEILEMYSKQISTLIIYNQNWIGDNTVRFIDLGLDKYLKDV